MTHPTRLSQILRWSARLLGGALFVFWGAFFVEHLAFFLASPGWSVWLLQSAHAVLLLGYLLANKWERLGSALIVAGAMLFFPFTAGQNAALFIAISVIPAGLYVARALVRQPAAASPERDSHA